MSRYTITATAKDKEFTVDLPTSKSISKSTDHLASWRVADQDGIKEFNPITMVGRLADGRNTSRLLLQRGEETAQFTIVSQSPIHQTAFTGLGTLEVYQGQSDAPTVSQQPEIDTLNVIQEELALVRGGVAAIAVNRPG